MPLVKGKSEMAGGEPRKQALAIAYAVKRRMGKKSEADASPSGDVLEQQRFDHAKLAHGQLPQPAQQKFGYSPRGVDPNIRPEPSQAQAKFSESTENEHFAMGGEVKAAMSRRERALMAARGEHPSHHDQSQMDHAERYPGVGHSDNEGASQNGGPSGRSTRMPLTPEGVEAGPPSSNRISPEEQAMFAKGGPVAMADYHRQRAAHYEKMADGGSVGAPINPSPTLKSNLESERSKSADSGPGALKEGFSDFTKGLGKAAGVSKGMAEGGYASPELSEEEQAAFYDRGGITRSSDSERFAFGGHAGGGKAIASRIRAQKQMAFGGRAHTDDDRPEDGESIDNFRREDHPDNDFLSAEEQTDYHHLNAGDLDEEAEQPKRKGMLDRIMRGIHARNGNP